jgi:hypothetical protein
LTALRRSGPGIRIDGVHQASSRLSRRPGTRVIVKIDGAHHEWATTPPAPAERTVVPAAGPARPGSPVCRWRSWPRLSSNARCRSSASDLPRHRPGWKVWKTKGPGSLSPRQFDPGLVSTRPLPSDKWKVFIRPGLERRSASPSRHHRGLGWQVVSTRRRRDRLPPFGPTTGPVDPGTRRICYSKVLGARSGPCRAPFPQSSRSDSSVVLGWRIEVAALGGADG